VSYVDYVKVFPDFVYNFSDSSPICLPLFPDLDNLTLMNSYLSHGLYPPLNSNHFDSSYYSRFNTTAKL